MDKNLEAALDNALTVREVMSILEMCDPEAKVVFAYNYGDHWKTLVAPGVGRVEPGAVRWSEYHRIPSFVPVDEDDEGQYAEDCTTVVVLS